MKRRNLVVQLSLLLLSSQAFGQAATPGTQEKALQAKTVAEALMILGVRDPEPGKRVRLDTPDIVVSGAPAAVRVTSRMPGTDWIAVFAERNPTPLIEVKEFSPGIDQVLDVQVALKQTGRIKAIVRASGKYFQVSREVKVATVSAQK